MGRFKSLEICAGAGGQALGLEHAGFDPVLLLDHGRECCETLLANRPEWNVVRADLRDFDAEDHPEALDVDLLSGGVPCAPYSPAGAQDGDADARDLLEVAIYLAYQTRPRAIMIENTADLATSRKFARNRENIEEHLRHLGYQWDWRVVDAQDHGVPQRRRSSVLVAMAPAAFRAFVWPEPVGPAPTVAETLLPSMAERGWPHAAEWAEKARHVAPTIVGGSDRHGGADLGPSRSKIAWARLGINGSSLAAMPPGAEDGFDTGVGKNGREGLPKLTIEQVALLQGFPEDWHFVGRKTARYRLVGNAFPPPVAQAMGRRIAHALTVAALNG